MKTSTRIISQIGGANINTLKLVPNEAYKFVAIGLLMIAVSLIAMLSMYFALDSIIDTESASNADKALHIIGSLFWGLVVLAIEYGLVSTMRKPKQVTLRSFFSSLMALSYRLALAVLLSFVITLPMKVAVFHDYLPMAQEILKDDFLAEQNAPLERIGAELEAAKKEADKQYDSSLVIYSQRYSSNAEYEALQSKVDRAKSEFNRTKTTIQKKIDGARSSNSYANRQIEELQGQIEDLDSELNLDEITDLKNQISNLNANVQTRNGQISYWQKQIRQAKKPLLELQEEQSLLAEEIDQIAQERLNIVVQQRNNADTKVDLTNDSSAISILTREIEHNNTISEVLMDDNLISAIIAIHRLIGMKDDPNALPAYKLVAEELWLFTILFTLMVIAIDIAPLVTKSMIKRGPYDIQLDLVDQKAESEASEQLSMQANKSTARVAAGEVHAATTATYNQLNDFAHEMNDMVPELIQKMNSINTHGLGLIREAEESFDGQSEKESVLKKSFSEGLTKLVDSINETFGSMVKNLNTIKS